jgi:hypothetical protein
MTAEPVTVQETPMGSTIYIGKDNLACIVVTQRLYNKPKRGKISGEIRMAQLSDDISRVFSLGLRAGDRLDGKIVLKNEDGYEWSYYTEEESDKDDARPDTSRGL